MIRKMSNDKFDIAAEHHEQPERYKYPLTVEDIYRSIRHPEDKTRYLQKNVEGAVNILSDHQWCKNNGISYETSYQVNCKLERKGLPIYRVEDLCWLTIVSGWHVYIYRGCSGLDPEFTLTEKPNRRKKIIRTYLEDYGIICMHLLLSGLRSKYEPNWTPPDGSILTNGRYGWRWPDEGKFASDNIFRLRGLK